MSLKYILVWPVENDMLKNVVQYKKTICGAPFTTSTYHLQIYGLRIMEPYISTTLSCDMSLKYQ